MAGELPRLSASHPEISLRSWWRRLDLRLLALAVAASMLTCCLALLLGFFAGRPVEMRFGPADAEYTRGFRVRWQPGTTLRWAKAEAEVRLPLEIRGPVRVKLLGSRPGLRPARMQLYQGDVRIGTLMAGPERVSESFELVPGGAARLVIRCPDSEAEKSIQLSGVTLAPAAPAAILPSWRVLARTCLAAAVLSIVLFLAGWTAWGAVGLTAALLGLPLALGSLLDPFATLHLVTKIGVLTPLATGLLLLLTPRRIRRRAGPVLAMALLLRLGLVFHPGYHYQDVGIHQDVTVVAVENGPLELWRNMPEYQRSFQLGLATVAGQWKAFPYPPTFYTLAALLPLGPAADAVKALGALASGLVVALIISMAARLDPGGSADLRAGLLAVFLPADLEELLRASYPALLGHALDTGLVVLLAWRWDWLRHPRGIAVMALWIACCGLGYNAGPVHLVIFLPLLMAIASMPRALPGRCGLLLSSALGGAVASSYYLPSVTDVASNALHSARAGVSWPGLTVASLNSGWDQIGVPFLWVGGIGLAAVLIRRWQQPEARVVAAWAAYVAAISVPVLLFPEVFGYFRRLYFVQPLGPLLAALPGVGRRWVTLPLLAVLVLWSLLSLTEFVTPFFVSHSGQIGV